MSDEMVTCPSCGKQTFKRKFCLFCGKSLTPTIPARVPTTVEKVSMPPTPTEEVVTPPVSGELSTLEQRLQELVELRSKFDDKLEKFGADWSRLKSSFEEQISLLEKEVEEARAELKELEFLHSIEEVTAEDYREKSPVLTGRIEQAEKTITALMARVKNMEDLHKGLVEPKLRRRAKERKDVEKETEEKLAKLEEAYKAGTVRREVYEKLKARYEKEHGG